jgi:hypothetical protein
MRQLDDDGIVGLGDDVFLVSRFITYQGANTNWPAVRFGNISVLPRDDEPIDITRGMSPQVAYLIETRTTPGSSGSPVFHYIPGWEQREAPWGGRRAMLDLHTLFAKASYQEKMKEHDYNIPPEVTPLPPQINLLGVSGGWLFGPDEQVVYPKGTDRKLSDLRITRNSGMEWCVPAWKLVELLNEPVLRELRELQRKEWNQEPPPAGAPC